MEIKQFDQSDYIESAAYLATEDNAIYGKPCSAPCKSCGGGCYGCKGSKGASASLNGKESKLAEMVENVLE
ncbi:MAG: hypothetical protein ABIE36_02990 [Candidatus Diapherotrites archaeon]